MGLFGRKPEARNTSTPLRLMAEDAGDLPPLAALVQDAALRLGDIAYDPAGRHLTLRMNRFCHEAATLRKGTPPLRAPSVLRICGVTKVQRRGLDLRQPHLPLSLLDIAAEPAEPPAHVLILRFAGEGTRDIRIETECVDVLLMDLSAPRRARLAPQHG